MAADRGGAHLDLLLLSVLVTGPAHGYGVIARLRERSDGSFDLAEGSVYPALHRMEREGLLASRWDASGERRRRVYQITGAGRSALAAKREQWRSFSRSVHRVVGWAT